MRVLFATGSPARYMAPPTLGDEQVNCGPDRADERDADGHWVSLKTPVGEYNLATIAAKLGTAQKPDLVVCLVDASWRNQPRGLAAFKCPCVLLVADTHHLRRPITGMLRYMTSEPFTRSVLLYDRHHAEIFHSAGIKNLFWFPGLTVPHSDAVVKAARSPDLRGRHVAFVGSTSSIHLRRAHLLARLKAQGISVESMTLPQAEALEFCGHSLVGFNASLNGDLNLRVFETLAAGAALLTDRLSPAAGLNTLLTEGREFLAYGSIDELVERAIHALAHPQESGAIGAAGAKWFDERFNEIRRREAFRALAFDGVSLPEFAFTSAESGKTLFCGSLGELVGASLGYERLQELHRESLSVRVALAPDVPADITKLCLTLPRIECVADRAGTTADVVVISKDALALPLTSARHVWCWNAAKNTVVRSEATLVANDFVKLDPAVTWFSRKSGKASDGRKHILLYTDDPESGGVAQYNHSVLMALVGAGYRVSCAQSLSLNPMVEKQQRAGVVHHWIDYHTGRDFNRTLQDGGLAERLFTQDSPDLIIFSDCCPLSNLAAREVARRLEIPYLVVVGFVGAYLAKNFAPVLPMLKGQHAAARTVIAVSEDNRKLLVTLFGVPRERCHVIHYGRPDRFFAPVNPATRARLRGELSIPPDAVVCLTTARLATVKGFEHQLRAIEELRNTPAFDKLHFVWAGEGELRAALEKEISRLGLQQRVHLLGHRWDAADWYDAADIFVLPSHTEGMPLSIMEAMAKGLPVVASAVSGIPEELGATGRLLTDPGVNPKKTAEELARTLAGWTLAHNARAATGSKGKLRAEEFFREELMLRNILRAVRDALNELEHAVPAAAVA